MCHAGKPSSLPPSIFGACPSSSILPQCAHACSSAWHTILQLYLHSPPTHPGKPSPTVLKPALHRSQLAGVPVTSPTLEALCYLCWAQASREGVKNTILKQPQRY